MKKYQIIYADQRGGKMADIIDKETSSISLAALSKFNGKTEVENAKMIILLLAQKAEAYGIPQTIRLTYKGNKAESDIELGG